MIKKFLLSVLLLLPVVCSVAQTPLPDPLPETAGKNHHFYPNLGQIATDSGIQVPSIRYYSHRTSPQLFFADTKVSFSIAEIDTGGTDSSFRFDMQFVCPSSGCSPTITLSEAGTEKLNYYLPHCGPAGITGVGGQARLVYNGAFPNIDVHFYSNGAGLKNYIVVQPGGSPNDIAFAFTGQDSLLVLADGTLRVKVKEKIYDFPRPTAYQINATSQPVGVGWIPTWILQGATARISTGPFTSTMPLVLKIARPYSKVTGNDNLEWSTYYGAQSTEHWARICADANGDLYQGMTEAGHFFPPLNGAGKVTNGDLDIFFSKFNKDAEMVWGTYYGGSGNETIGAIELGLLSNADVGGFYVGGGTTSNNLPVTSGNGYTQSTYGGYAVPNSNDGDGLLASFDKLTGIKSWSTYFGGSGNDAISSIAVDNAGGKLYIAGNTRMTLPSAVSLSCAEPLPGKFPLCAGLGNYFFQSVPGNNRDGFIAEFDLNTRNLTWSTFFGGMGEDRINDILKLNRNGVEALFVCGQTSSPAPATSTSPITVHTGSSFPLAQPSQPCYYQTSTGSFGGQGFIGKFNAGKQLAWSTFFGGSKDDKLHSIAINSRNEVYVSGITNSDAPAASNGQSNPSNLFPVLKSNADAYLQQQYGGGNSDALLAKFSFNGLLQWSTYYGGNGDEGSNNPVTSVVVDNLDNVYVAGYTNADYSGSGGNMPVFYAQPGYWQPSNASSGTSAMLKDDGWLLMLDANEQPLWGTHFGGTVPPGRDPAVNAHEIITDIAISGHDNLFMSGLTTCPSTPMRCPSMTAYCDNSYNGLSDAFVGRFRVRPMATSIQEPGQQNPVFFSVYPNPSENLFRIRLFRSAGFSRQWQLTLTGNAGNVLRSSTVQIEPGQEVLGIDLSGLPDGVYFLELSDGQQRCSNKLVKMQ